MNGSSVSRAVVPNNFWNAAARSRVEAGVHPRRTINAQDHPRSRRRGCRWHRHAGGEQFGKCGNRCDQEEPSPRLASLAASSRAGDRPRTSPSPWRGGRRPLGPRAKSTETASRFGGRFSFCLIAFRQPISVHSRGKRDERGLRPLHKVKWSQPAIDMYMRGPEVRGNWTATRKITIR
jgi:hypothetical protein